MKVVNIHQAKTQLSKLVARAEQGEEIIIGRSGKPVAKLTLYDAGAKPRKPGLWKGKVTLAKDFDRLPRRLLKLFQGTT